MKSHQRKGIGSEMIDFFKKKAKRLKLRGISVSTGSKNSLGHSFYKKNGFEKVGEVRKYYEWDPKHIFYWWNIKG